jgi:hypothetical protein
VCSDYSDADEEPPFVNVTYAGGLRWSNSNNDIQLFSLFADVLLIDTLAENAAYWRDVFPLRIPENPFFDEAVLTRIHERLGEIEAMLPPFDPPAATSS